MIRSLLVANRGEIAVRIVRAARERGMRSITVFSEPDRLAPHVLEADEAYPIGPAASAESYLRADKLIEVAKASGAEAIHPGYGFLAEQASFAQAVEDAGLIFVGPTPETIAAMGDKTEARRRMAEAGGHEPRRGNRRRCSAGIPGAAQGFRGWRRKRHARGRGRGRRKAGLRGRSA